MTPLLSVYLDLVRIGAALVVVIFHATPTLFPQYALPWPGHDAVIVFFVLSGVVIAHASAKESGKATSTWRDYAARRLARVWSVALPALLLGAITSAIVAPFAFPPKAFSTTDPALIAGHSLANALFVAQNWTANVWAPVNGPFWSLNYEIWYYIIFGIAQFAPKSWRGAGVTAACLLAGQKILILAPCWFAGVWLYRLAWRPGPRTATALFILSAAAYAVVFWFDWGKTSRIGLIQILPWLDGRPYILEHANRFPADWAIAAAISLNFIAMRGMTYLTPLAQRLRPLIARASGYTFSVYLFHMPLMVLFTGGLKLAPIPTMAATAICIIILGNLTEHRLPTWRRLTARLLRTAP